MTTAPASIPVLSFDGRAGLQVDVDKLVRSRLLIQAASGAGKSWMLRTLLEQTHGKVQQFIIDPDGEFATLRDAFDYVIVGEGGDLAADPAHARVLCRRLMELGASAVLDLYALDLPQRREFVANFLGELMRLPKALWRPLLVVIDEAHTLAPEGEKPEKMPSLGAIVTVGSQGRKRRYCLALLTQRLSKIHKDAAGDLSNVLIGRTGLDVDVDRAAKTLGFKAARRMELQTLPDGVFFGYGPAISPTVIKVAAAETRTHTAKGGDETATKVAPAKSAVRDILKHLADVPAAAEAEADELETLRRKVAELQHQVEMEGAAGPTLEDCNDAIQREVSSALLSHGEQWEAALAAAVERERDEVTRALTMEWSERNAQVETHTRLALHAAVDTIATAVENARQGMNTALEEVREFPIPPTHSPADHPMERNGAAGGWAGHERPFVAAPSATHVPATFPDHVTSKGEGVWRKPPVMIPRETRPAAPAPAKAPRPAPPDGELPAGAMKWLGVLAQLEAVGQDGAPVTVVVGLAGQSPRSSNVDLFRRKLMASGYLYTTGERIGLTDIGRRKAPPADKPLTRAAYYETWRRLVGTAAPLLDFYIKNPNITHAPTNAAMVCGMSPKSSNVEAFHRKLAKFGLIAGSMKDGYRATAALFPRGLR